VRVLLLVLFGATVLGAVGLSGSALAADAMGAEVLGILVYASAPGVLGALLARHVRTGGTRVRWGVVAVQVWLILGGLGNLGDGSPDGLTQLVLPVLIIVLISRPGSRAWFRLPPAERGRPPKFSLPHMITWKRDRGQTALEYLGLVLIVVALIAALTVGGLGGRITEGLQSAICSLTGNSCPVSPGSGSVEAGDRTDGDTDGGAEGGADGGTSGSADPGADRGTVGEARGGANSGVTGGTDGGTTDGGTDGGSTTTGGTTGGTTDGATTGGTGGPGDTGRPGPGEDTYPEDSEEPEAAYDVQASDDGEGEGEGGGEQTEEKEDCGGWGFFGCAWDRTTQVVKGLVVDGLWGDITGIVDLFKPETWSGLADYGRQLGDQWGEDSSGAGDKWADGDYLGAVGDWGRASVNTVVTVGDDVFVGDEVRERWNNGEKTRAVTDVIWNVGSIFIPGYNVGKVVGKVGRLGVLGEAAGAVGRAADDAGAAARRARKAAEAGDLDGARKAAKEADDAADSAEDAARRTGCVIASGPPPVRYGGGGTGGVPGSGTGVLAGGSPARTVLANDGCDEAAKAAAARARAAERAAHLEQKRLEEPERARKAEAEKKQYPDPKRNDTSDPRNYTPPSWAKDLVDRKLGDADGGDGYWASRDRNPAPNWKRNEPWLRYQEQVTNTRRGQEYVVPHPREGKPAVEYDGWDSSRQTFLEAKNGYGSYLSKTDSGTLTRSGKDKFVTEARAQVEASGGRTVEWHFSDPAVAKAARKAFREEGLPVRVVHSPTKPNDSTRKPGAFDE
jgi:hypothetical protein